MDLTIENSWWFEGGLWQDSDLMRAREALFQYHPKPFSLEDLQTHSVFTLRGPRRVGKTATLKLLIASLIEDHGVLPRSILWLNLDTIRTPRQLEELILRTFQSKRGDGFEFIFIDEVTSVIGWQKVIKKYRDNGLLDNRSILLTGSSSYDLKAGAERMAGRRGRAENPDRVLLPVGPLQFSTLVASHGVSAEDAVKDFLSVGGFPFRINGYLRARKEAKTWDPLEGFSIFEDIVFYEFSRRRLDRGLAGEVIGRLCAVGAHAISYSAFAKGTASKPDTVRRYLDALGDAYLIASICSYDTARGRVAPKKDRKFLRIDPALGFLAQALRQGPANDEAARAEWAVGAILLKEFEARLFEGLSAPRNIFTWKSSSGNEVDYLVMDRSRSLVLPVEVKWQASVSDWDFQSVERAFGKGYLVTPGLRKERSKATALPLAEFERALAAKRYAVTFCDSLRHKK